MPYLEAKDTLELFFFFSELALIFKSALTVDGHIVFIYLFLFLRERVQAGKGERERERESQAGSALSEQSLMQGSNSQNRELTSRVGRLGAPGWLSRLSGWLWLRS